MVMTTTTMMINDRIATRPMVWQCVVVDYSDKLMDDDDDDDDGRLIN